MCLILGPLLELLLHLHNLYLTNPPLVAKMCWTVPCSFLCFFVLLHVAVCYVSWLSVSIWVSVWVTLCTFATFQKGIPSVFLWYWRSLPLTLHGPRCFVLVSVSVCVSVSVRVCVWRWVWVLVCLSVSDIQTYRHKHRDTDTQRATHIEKHTERDTHTDT